MTPCEKLGYKVGDRFEIIKGNNSGFEWRKIGRVISLKKDDGSNAPFFDFGEGKEWCVELDNIRPLKTEAEKRDAKFGTMGVVKSTGERCVYIDESLVLPGYWEIDVKGKADRWHRNPSEIRLDHEPEYKEIPFSEATDDQRRNAEHITGTNGEDVQEIYAFSNGAFGYTIKGSSRVFHETSVLTVRVPA